MQPPDIIIPVYNEEEALPEFLAALGSLSMEVHPIFVDNGSSDRTGEIISTVPHSLIIRLDTNKGYGGAIKEGLQASSAEKVIVIDGDGEYSPDVIPEIVRQLDHHEVVHTSRFLAAKNPGMSTFRYFGNRCITAVFNLLFRQQLTDLYTGCKGYRSRSLSSLLLQQNGFEHVLEVTAHLVRQNTKILEIPVFYKQRERGFSKMSHLRESIKYFFFVVYYYLFLPTSRRP